MELSGEIRGQSNKNKKPAASERDYYLGSFVRHLIQKADSEKDSKKRAAFLERAMVYVRSIRRDAGFSPWPATVFATCLIVVGALWLHARWPKSFFYSYPTNYLRIVQRLNDRDFMVQRVEAGLAQETTMMRFCDDAKLPWFEGGHILQWIRYDDHGSCQSIGPEDRGFDILRDSKGLPITAPNCPFDPVNNRLACNGVPKFD